VRNSRSVKSPKENKSKPKGQMMRNCPPKESASEHMIHTFKDKKSVKGHMMGNSEPKRSVTGHTTGNSSPTKSATGNMMGNSKHVSFPGAWDFKKFVPCVPQTLGFYTTHNSTGDMKILPSDLQCSKLSFDTKLAVQWPGFQWKISFGRPPLVPFARCC